MHLCPSQEIVLQTLYNFTFPLVEIMEAFYSCEGLSYQRWVAAPLFPELKVMDSLGQK